jgi:hypothetical protein
VVDVHTGDVGAYELEVDDDLVIEVPRPWNGPVKVVHRDAGVLRLATLRGHLEVGQVQFHARPDDRLLVFEIELWARTVDRLVRLLYTRLGLAKEVQLNGRLVDGVHIVTRWTEPTPRDHGTRDVRRTGGERRTKTRIAEVLACRQSFSGY